MSEACKFTRLGKKIDKISSITARQLYTLTMQNRSNNYQILGKRVKRGTFHRVRSQGIDNVTKSLMTLSLLVACDVISLDDITTIIQRITSLLEEDIDPEDMFRIIRKYLKESFQ